MDYIFIVGADDPELVHIKLLLSTRGYQVCQAFCRGCPVTASTAYSADSFFPAVDLYDPRIVWVECGATDSAIPRVTVIDHHREGDPGYACGPEDFWQGSSIGQLCNLIGEQSNPELLLVAAADHCLHEAYRGRCPGISPLELMDWRVKWRARRQGLKPHQLLARIRRTTAAISGLPVIEFRGCEIVDAIYQSLYELHEAIAIQGKAVMWGYRDETNGMEKISLYGATPEATSAWMEAVIATGAAYEVYGNPHRSYAGARFYL